METILFLAHTEDDDSLAKAAFETVTAAKALCTQASGAKLLVGLVGGQVQPAANLLAECGAQKFLAVMGPDFAMSRYASDAAGVEAIIKASRATLIVAPGTTRWNRVLAGVAQRTGAQADTHVSSVASDNGEVTVSRWFYRQRIEAKLRRKHRPWLILIEPGSQSPWQGPPAAAQVELLAVELPENCRRTTVVGVRQNEAGSQTIRPEAQLLFVAGAGWTKKQGDGQTHLPEAQKLILEFLQQSCASLGSSKSLVDLGNEGQPVLPFLTHLNQVGQTGSTPRHPKGLATCCHGEEPHTVGWRFINERRAINLDPNCGWARGKADVLYVADAFAVISKVNELLRARNTYGAVGSTGDRTTR